jgi:hypothetical protein
VRRSSICPMLASPKLEAAAFALNLKSNCVKEKRIQHENGQCSSESDELKCYRNREFCLRTTSQILISVTWRGKLVKQKSDINIDKNCLLYFMDMLSAFFADRLLHLSIYSLSFFRIYCVFRRDTNSASILAMFAQYRESLGIAKRKQ